MKPYAIVAPCYPQQGGGSELEAAHTLNILREEIARMPEPPVLIDLFGLRRFDSAHPKADAAEWIRLTPQPPSLRQPIGPPTKPPSSGTGAGSANPWANADAPVVKRKKKFRVS